MLQGLGSGGAGRYWRLASEAGHNAPRPLYDTDVGDMMVLDERSRHHLHQQLESASGADAAATLMEHLPPVGWADVATKRDLDHLATLTTKDIDLLRRGLSAEIAGVRTDLTAEIATVRTDLGAEIAGVRTDLGAEIAGVRTELGAEIAGVRTDLGAEIAGVRTELGAEIAGVRTDLSAQMATGFADTRAEIQTQLRSGMTVNLTIMIALFSVFITAAKLI